MKNKCLLLALSSATFGWGGTATFVCQSLDMSFSVSTAGAQGGVVTPDRPFCMNGPSILNFGIGAAGPIAGVGDMYINGFGGSLGVAAGQIISAYGSFALAPDGNASGLLGLNLVVDSTGLQPLTERHQIQLVGTYIRQAIQSGARFDFVFADPVRSTENPEPATWLLMGMGIAGLLCARPRARRENG